MHDFLGRIGTHQLNLRPDFQRFYIWDREKERAFIDSLLRDYAVPPLWLWGHSGPDGKTTYEVIDGQQRLTCIRRFVENDFTYVPVAEAPGDATLSQYTNSYYDKVPAGKVGKVLADDLRNRLQNYWMPFVLVQTDERSVVIDIFRRLNKSSTNLTPQELRNAFFAGHFKTMVYTVTEKLQHDAY